MRSRIFIYGDKEDIMNLLLENKHILSAFFKRGLDKQKIHIKLHVDNILQKYLRDKRELKTKYLK